MERAVIRNPVLRGFNPDPSVVRVGDDYYMATSTFEWFPGIQIHHSRDLVHWDLIYRPLNQPSQLNMLGDPDSCGVWAPCLSYDNGRFYLVFCHVRSFDGVWKDTHNYLVSCERIDGEWSNPIYLNSMGFDGSLFHDKNGKKWYISMLVDHRKGKFFGGIVLQEYDYKAAKLTGPVHYVFEGTELGKTEGPHLYQKDGFYYLLLAEGGTEYGHAISLARSREITGPYELHPRNPMVTCRDNPSLPLQKSGHGDLFQTPNGDWYIAFLVGRPLSKLGRCTLGRESAIQNIKWENGGWPELSQGGNEPLVEVDAPDVKVYPFNPLPGRDDFESTKLNIHWQWLRNPDTSEWLSLEEHPGYLRLRGMESLTSFHKQSMLARRIQHFHIEASTCIEFEPENFQQMAGIICYYNTSHYHYLHVSGGYQGQDRLLQIITCDKFQMSEPMGKAIALPKSGRVFLKAIFNRAELQFFYAIKDGEWIQVGPVLDGSILSDDYVREEERYRPAFTGAFVGLCCQDLSGNRKEADFDWFDYKEIDN